MTGRYRWYLIAILAFSVILRVAAAVYLGNSVEILPGTYDQVSYHNLSLRLIDGYGFSFGQEWWPITDAGAPTAHWSFLYTFYVAGIYSLFGIQPLMARLVQALVVGILLPWLTYKLGKHLFDEMIGLVAAGITAIYLYFVYYAGTLMTESFYIVALLASFYLAMRLVEPATGAPVPVSGPGAAGVSTRNWVGTALMLGVAVGSAALLRQLSILFIPFLFVWIWWAGRTNHAQNVLRSLAVASIVICVMILPFSIYNSIRFDRFVLLNTNAGYAFFWGNHPIYGTHFESILPREMGTYQGLIPQELYDLDEAALDQELLKRGIQFILDDPGRYVLLSISRIPAYFMFWPSNESELISNISRVFSFGIAWPFMLIGLGLAPYSHRLKEQFALHSSLALLYLFALIYTLIHLLTWALIRYRLPVDAVLILFAAVSVVHIFEWIIPRITRIKGS
jgi:4-amino-4-deoxy-L-arabinose transferase-like glycosyltransferase